MKTLFSLVFAAGAGVLLFALFYGVPAPEEAGAAAPLAPEFSPRFHFRPVLRGKGIPGNAAEYFRRAALTMLNGGGFDVAADIEAGRMPSDPDHAVWYLANRNALEEMRRGTNCIGAALAADPLLGSDAPAVEVARGVELAALAVEASLQSADKDRLEAGRLLLDAVRFGQDLQRCGGLVHRLYGLRIEFMSLRWFIDFCSKNLDSADCISILAGEYSRLESGRHGIEESIRTEGALLFGTLLSSGGDSETAGAGIETGSSTAAGEWAGEAMKLLGGGKTSGPESVEAALSKSGGGGAVADAWKRLAWAVEAEPGVEALRRAAGTVLELRAYRKAWGKFPASPEELSRGGAAIPCDPFTGASFGYSRAGDTVILTCAGPDRKIDGMPGKVDFFEDGPGDWRFRVDGGGR